MIGIIEDFNNVSPELQRHKLREEVEELIEAINIDNDKEILLEGCDVVQAVITLLYNKGIIHSKHDFEEAMANHYIRQVGRGRTVKEI